MHGSGWWLFAAIPMMLFMAAMMWMMMRGGSSPDSSERSDTSTSKETPLEILDRRLADGEITLEEHRLSRDALDSGSGEPSGDKREQPLTGART